MSHTYTDKDCLAFVEWAEERGLPLRHYCGRYDWQGPGVTLGHLGEVIECPVRWQSDSMGMQVIVYPVRSDEGTSNRRSRSGFGVEEDDE